jgi:hypothetical protein
VKAEIAIADASAARTDGPVAAVVVWGIASAMPGCSAPPSLRFRPVPSRVLTGR